MYTLIETSDSNVQVYIPVAVEVTENLVNNTIH